MKRQFVTKSDIDTLVEQGQTVLEVDDTTTVTDLAREHARQRGVSIRRTAGATTPDRGSSTSERPATAGVEDLSRLRGAVRSAVIGRLGEVPPGLDEALDRVLGE